jgi:hypothetical protein
MQAPDGGLEPHIARRGHPERGKRLCEIGRELLVGLGKARREPLGLRVEIEQSAAGDVQGELHQVGQRVKGPASLGVAGPLVEDPTSALCHDRTPSSDLLAMKGRLHDAALPPPNVVFAADQTVPQERLHHLKEECILCVVFRALDQDGPRQVRVVDKNGPQTKEAKGHYIAHCGQLGKETQRVTFEPSGAFDHAKR